MLVVNLHSDKHNCLNYIQQYFEERFRGKYEDSALILSYFMSKETVSKLKIRLGVRRIMVFQSEQVCDKKCSFSLNKKTLNFLNECDEIWDYDEKNVERLSAKIDDPSKIKLVKLYPIRYNGVSDTEKDIDILFYGSLNDRRIKILDQIDKKYNLFVISASKPQRYNGLCACSYGDELYKYIDRAKIVLNLHYYESCIEEQVRITELLSRNKIVLSEDSVVNNFENYYTFGLSENINDKIAEILSYGIVTNYVNEPYDYNICGDDYFSVVTFIFGGYEKMRELPFRDNSGRVEYLCITDNKSLKSDTWNVIYDEWLSSSELNSRQRYYYAKTHVCDYVSKKSKAIMRIDGSMSLNYSPYDFLRFFCNAGYDISVNTHYERNNILVEYDTWIRCRGLDRKYKDMFIKFANENSFNTDISGLFETGFCVLRNSPHVSAISKRVYELMDEVNGVNDLVEQNWFSYLILSECSKLNILYIHHRSAIESELVSLYLHGSNRKFSTGEVYDRDTYTESIGGKSITTHNFNHLLSVSKFGDTSAVGVRDCTDIVAPKMQRKMVCIILDYGNSLWVKYIENALRGVCDIKVVGCYDKRRNMCVYDEGMSVVCDELLGGEYSHVLMIKSNVNIVGNDRIKKMLLAKLDKYMHDNSIGVYSPSHMYVGSMNKSRRFMDSIDMRDVDDVSDSIVMFNRESLSGLDKVSFGMCHSGNGFVSYLCDIAKDNGYRVVVDDSVYITSVYVRSYSDETLAAHKRIFDRLNR